MYNRKIIESISRLFLYILLIYSIIFLIGGILNIIFRLILNEIVKDPYLYTKFIDSVCILITSLILFKITKKYFYNKINIKAHNPKLFIKSFTIVSLLLLFVFLISYFFGSATIHGIPIISTTNISIIKSIVITGLTGSLLISISEEIIFRGLLFNYTLKISKNIFLSVIVCSLIFALGHTSYHSIVNYLIAFLGGISMSIAYILYNNLFYPIGIHFSYNLFNFFFTNNEPNKHIFRPLYITYNKFHGIYIIDIFIILFFISFNIFLLSKYLKIKRGCLSHGEALISQGNY